MRRFRILMIMLVLLAFAGLALAGPADKAPSPPRSTADVVVAKVLPAKLTGKAGEQVSFKVDLAIADTWHLYDHRYVGDEESFFIGVDLMPGEDANLAGFQTTFPDGDEGEFMGEKVHMLHHHAAIDVTITLPADATGQVTVPLVLTAQACDDSICLQPSDVPVTATITVE
jgi:hypothetical protein